MGKFVYIKFGNNLHRIQPFRFKNQEFDSSYWKIATLESNGEWNEEVCVYDTQSSALKQLQRIASRYADSVDYKETNALEEEYEIIAHLYANEMERLELRLSEIKERIKELKESEKS